MSKLYDILNSIITRVKKAETPSDWNQNDPAMPDYVKNRLAWTDDPMETVFFNGTVVNNDSIDIELIVGQEYVVTLDGAEYVSTAWDDGDDCIIIGSESLWRETNYIDTELPFTFGTWGDGSWFYTINDGEEHSFKVSGNVAEVHKIDEKYLPEQTHYDNRTMLVDYDGHYSRVIFDADGNAAFYYLTSDTFTVEELIGKRIDYIELGERYGRMITADLIEDANGDGTLINVDGTVIICNAENIVFNNITFPHKGLYVISPDYCGYNYSLQIYEGSYKQLNAKYLPDSILAVAETAQTAQDTAETAQAIATIQSDWSQNDETSVDYIKNRTHYIEYNMREFSPTEYGAIAYNGAVKISNLDIVSAMNYDPNNVIVEYRYDTSSDWQPTIGLAINISNTKRYYYKSLDNDYLFWYDFDGYVYNNFTNTSKDNLYIRFSGTVADEHYVPLDVRFIPDSVATVEQIAELNSFFIATFVNNDAGYYTLTNSTLSALNNKIKNNTLVIAFVWNQGYTNCGIFFPSSYASNNNYTLRFTRYNSTGGRMEYLYYNSSAGYWMVKSS